MDECGRAISSHLQRKYQIQEHHMLLAVTVSCGEPNVLITADVAVVMETLQLLAFLISFSMSMFKKAVALNLRK